MRPFPPLKVNDFTVSKHFFRHAARAYITNQNLGNDAINSIDANTDIIRAYGNRVKISSAVIYPARHMLNLRHLVLLMDVDVFETDDPIFAQLHLVSSQQIRGTKAYRIIMAMKTLQGFSATVDESSYLYEPAELDTMNRNAAAFAHEVNCGLKTRETVEAEPEVLDATATMPLYRGSRVAFDGSKLLPDRQYTGPASDAVWSSKVLSQAESQGAGNLQKSDSQPHHADQTLKKPVIKLHGQDIPESANEFRLLFDTDEEAVMHWIRYVKKESDRVKLAKAPRSKPTHDKSASWYVGIITGLIALWLCLLVVGCLLEEPISETSYRYNWQSERRRQARTA